jgi:hypothetical protein
MKIVRYKRGKQELEVSVLKIEGKIRENGRKLRETTQGL